MLCSVERIHENGDENVDVTHSASISLTRKLTGMRFFFSQEGYIHIVQPT